MSGDALTDFIHPGPGAEELATLLSVAVQVEPELIRAIRLRYTPRHDVSAEGDLWLSDWVGTRSADTIRLRPELVPALRERLVRRLAADRQDPAWQLWVTLSEFHSTQSAALMLEELLTWTAVCEEAAGAPSGEAEELLQMALRAVVRQRRTGVADWFGAAWHRLPAAVQHTVTAWQLLQAAGTAEAVSAAESAEVADQVELSLADVHTLGPAVADTVIPVHHDGENLVLNAGGDVDAVLLPVPDTSPRLLEIRRQRPDGEERETVQVAPGTPMSVRVGADAVRVRNGRGDVFVIDPPARDPAVVATIGTVEVNGPPPRKPERRVPDVEPDVDPHAPLFYLSYARARPRAGSLSSDPNQRVRQLFDDLNDHVNNLVYRETGADAGFMDQSIGSGMQWQERVLHAAGTCQVFVALLSPAYLQSEYCALEWNAFAARPVVRRDGASGYGDTSIIPVVWIPPRPDTVPAAINRIQRFAPRRLPDESLVHQYAEDGLYGLLTLGVAGTDGIILRLAQQIVELAYHNRVERLIVPDMTNVPRTFT